MRTQRTSMIAEEPPKDLNRRASEGYRHLETRLGGSLSQPIGKTNLLVNFSRHATLTWTYGRGAENEHER
jgi:hypothetical protein